MSNYFLLHGPLFLFFLHLQSPIVILMHSDKGRQLQAESINYSSRCSLYKNYLTCGFENILLGFIKKIMIFLNLNLVCFQ